MEQKKFRYKVIAISINDRIDLVETELNRLGEEGWELVSVTGNPAINAHYIFKREI
jgi:hypothetical protein